MNKKVEERVAQLNAEICAVLKLDADVTLVEEVMPTAYIWLDSEVNVDFAASSMQEVKQVLAAFAKRGILLADFLSDATHPKWRLKGINGNILLTPNWSSEEGSVCRLVKVGEKTYTYPEYKLICEDKNGIPDAGEVID
jgi:hypothetical protein